MKQNIMKRAKSILNTLLKTYPNAKIELLYNKKDPWQLLVVVVLSAQSTDKKVNEISPALFAKFHNVHDFAKAKINDLVPYIKSLGLYKSKANNLIKAAEKLVKDFNGKLPKTRKELESLPGVGPKSSAVIVANAFNIPALAVDTHVARVSMRLGLTKSSKPEQIEKDLTALWQAKDLIHAHHTLIWHGRRICKAQKPLCPACPLNELCPKIGVKEIGSASIHLPILA